MLLVERDPSGHGFRRRPIVAADFHPRSVSSTRVPCAGIACGIRTRVPGLLCEAAAKPKPGVLSHLDEHDMRGSTSAVPERERPVGRGVSLHVTWPVTAHIPGHQHHVAWPRSARTHPEWSG
jgi:hypothetical protein